MAKKIIVCGAGRVGRGVSEYLVSQGYEITIIDNNAEVLSGISDFMDVRCIEGSASDHTILESAGIKDSDIIIAVTSTDEVNMVICNIASKLYNTKKAIARVRDKKIFTRIKDGDNEISLEPSDFGIDVVISPEKEIAKSICRSLKVPGAFSAFSVADRKLRILGVRCTDRSAVVNTPIKHINSLFPNLDISIVAIIRDGENLIPNDSEVVRSGDEVYFCVKIDQSQESVEAFIPQIIESGHVLILGGGSIGYFLARDIQDVIPGTKVKIIEKDMGRAKFLSKAFPDIVVICGDVLDENILYEAGIDEARTAIAVTENDSVNVLSSVLAKRMGAKNSQALINHDSYLSFAAPIGVDSFISPKMMTVSKVLRAIRSDNIKNLYTLRHGFAEIFDIDINDGNALIGKLCSELNNDNSLRVIAILRDGVPIIISNNDIKIENNDRVVMIVADNSVIKLEKMLA